MWKWCLTLLLHRKLLPKPCCCAFLVLYIPTCIYLSFFLNVFLLFLCILMTTDRPQVVVGERKFFFAAQFLHDLI